MTADSTNARLNILVDDVIEIKRIVGLNQMTLAERTSLISELRTVATDHEVRIRHLEMITYKVQGAAAAYAAAGGVIAGIITVVAQYFISGHQ